MTKRDARQATEGEKLQQTEPSANPKNICVRSLTKLALALQATLTKETLDVYCLVLSDQSATLISQACLELARRPRPQYAPRFPDAPEILAECRALSAKRAMEAPVKEILSRGSKPPGWDAPRLSEGESGGEELVLVADLAKRPEFRSVLESASFPRRREIRVQTPEEANQRLAELRGQAARLQPKGAA